MNTPPKAHDHIGAIDAGSNAIRFSVYRLNNRLTPILKFRKRFPVRLGSGTFTTGSITNDDINAAIVAFHEMAQTAHDMSFIALPAVATSAIREAGNCDHFLERVQTETGINLRAITGDQEARLAARGVGLAFKYKDGNLIIDIGGGSTELVKIAPDGEVAEAISLPMGAVRLAEHFKMSEVYTAEALSQMREIVLKTISDSDLQNFMNPPHTVCIGGTACALANATQHIQQGGSPGIITREDVADTTAELETSTVNSIARTAGIDDERARLIIPGAYILIGLLKFLHVKNATVSDSGVREGLVNEYLMSDTFEPVE